MKDPKVSRRKEITKIRAEIYEKGTIEWRKCQIQGASKTCLITDFESQFDIKVTHVTQGNDLLTWKRSFEPLSPWCLPNPLPSACQLLFVEIQRPDGKRSSRFRSAPGTQEAPRRLSQSLRLVSHCTNPCPQLSSEARPLNCESATTKVLPSSHFSTLGTSTLGTSPQEQPAPTSLTVPRLKQSIMK